MKESIIDFSLPFRIFSFAVFYTTLFFVKIFDRLVYGINIEGRENLRPFLRRGCFLISNYSLYLDPAIVSDAISPWRTYFSAMNITFKTFFIGTYIRLLGAFPIPENYGLGLILKPVKKALERGWFVHFFPEGDMVLHNHDLIPFKDGIFSLSILYDKPVIPITIVTRRRKLFNLLLPSRFIKLTVVISPAIYPGEYINKYSNKKKLLIKWLLIPEK